MKFVFKYAKLKEINWNTYVKKQIEVWTKSFNWIQILWMSSK